MLRLQDPNLNNVDNRNNGRREAGRHCREERRNI